MTISFINNDVIFVKELPFHNEFIKKTKNKHLKNVHLLAELPFYDQLNIIKTDQAFKGCAGAYKVEVVEKK